MFDDNTICKPTDNVTWRNVNDEVVVLKLESGEYFTFNDLGRDLWLEFAEGKEFAQIIQKLVDTYEVEDFQARGDVQNFATGLIEKGLLAKI